MTIMSYVSFWGKKNQKEEEYVNFPLSDFQTTNSFRLSNHKNEKN